MQNEQHSDVCNYIVYLPQCVICLKTLKNGSMKPFQLKQHLTTMHPQFQDKLREFFKLKTDNLKRQKLDSTRIFHQSSDGLLRASYEVTLLVAKNKKLHTIAENLIKPCLLKYTKLVLTKESCIKLQQISMSNNTIKSRITDMSEE